MGTITEYFDFIKKDKITSDDKQRYSHIDIKNKELKKNRRKYRTAVRKAKNAGINPPFAEE